MGNTTQVPNPTLFQLVKEGDIQELHHAFQFKADIDAEDSAGRSLLRYALEEDQAGVFKYLYVREAKLQPPLALGQTLLHLSVSLQKLNTTKTILRHPDIFGKLKDSRDSNGQTPLHLAVLQGNPDLVAILLKYNADSSVLDSAGRSAIDLASTSAHPSHNEILDQLNAGELFKKSLVENKESEDISPKNKESGSTNGSISTLNEFEQDRPVDSLEQTLRDHRIPIIKGCELEFVEMLNRGSSCLVYKGKWRGCDVAIKQFKIEYRTSAREHSKFIKELQVISSVRHPNLLLLMGICIDLPQLCLVTEFVPNSTLFGVLHRNKNHRLNLVERFNIAEQLCKAMTYLHENEPPIVHRDLKPENCLVIFTQLDFSLNLKVADFGLARPVAALVGEETGSQTTICIGTTRFMAPELFDKDNVGRVGVDVDIWALGCILIEIFSNKRPWDYISSSNSSCIYYEIFRKKPVPIPENVPFELKDLIRSCCCYNPKLRPSASEILDKVMEIKKLYC